MANQFPTTLNDWEPEETIESAWADSLEAKIGVDNSAVVTSLDYLLKNSASSNPGHKHTLAQGATDVTASAAELNTLDGYLGNVGDLNILQGLAAAGLTTTELGYVNGVTSSIQAQINTNITAIGLNTTHRTSDGSDHAYIDQDVTSGSSPTFNNDNFTATSNKNYVTDAEKTVIGNTSGTNTGDNAANSSTHYIGTTEVALNRASAPLTLAGITLTTPNRNSISDNTYKCYRITFNWISR
jgi:hypothetical protein